MMPRSRLPLSLRARIALVSIAAMLLTLVLANSVLTRLFERQVTAQFQSSLKITLDQLAGGLGFDVTSGRLMLREPQGDPRWATPYSGTYWQILSSEAIVPAGLLRSRSLWDFTLTLPKDGLVDGAIHTHQIEGPNAQRLMALERTVRIEHDRGVAQFRLIAAADTRDLYAAIDEFNRTVVQYLIALGVALLGVLLVQLVVGLAPLKRLEASLHRLETGEATQLEGDFPKEVRPLVERFNTILSDYRRHVERARTLAGNLAHAVRTPLSVMANAASDVSLSPDVLRKTVAEHGAQAQAQINWHLKRSRIAAGTSAYGAMVEIRPLIDGIINVMQRVHADKKINFQIAIPVSGLCFKGESHDVQEIMGNLIENASKWARSTVRISLIESTPKEYGLIVEDDGPGVDPARYGDILKRGVRMDELTPGSGLGLAIVHELVGLYSGDLILSKSSLGGLAAQVRLPMAIGATAS